MPALGIKGNKSQIRNEIFNHNHCVFQPQSGDTSVAVKPKKNIKAPEERNITMCTVIPESCHPGPDPGSPVSSRSPVIPESCHPGVLSSRNLVIPESCHPGILSSRSPVIPESCHPGPDPGSSVSFVKKVIVLYVKPPCRLMQLMQA